MSELAALLEEHSLREPVEIAIYHLHNDSVTN